MQHAILGAGAIGGLTGTALASIGEDVTVLVRGEALPNFPSTLTLERPTGTVVASVKAAALLTGPVDVLWIATKTYQLQDALNAIKATPRHVIPLLNGVDHVAVLRARFGSDDDRVLPATIAVEAEKLAAGRFIQRSPFLNLNLSSAGEQPLGNVIARLSDIGFTCRFVANEQTLLWSKLCFLGPLALATTASGLNIGGILGDTSWRHQTMSAIAEACAVATASGAEIDLHAVQMGVEKLPPGMRSSMQKDLAAVRPLELDALGGAIVRGGERYGIDVSTTKNLMEIILMKSAPSVS
jgi:2-dehydropantoate 2-reductase